MYMSHVGTNGTADANRKLDKNVLAQKEKDILFN